MWIIWFALLKTHPTCKLSQIELIGMKISLTCECVTSFECELYVHMKAIHCTSKIPHKMTFYFLNMYVHAWYLLIPQVSVERWRAFLYMVLYDPSMFLHNHNLYVWNFLFSNPISDANFKYMTRNFLKNLTELFKKIIYLSIKPKMLSSHFTLFLAWFWSLSFWFNICDPPFSSRSNEISPLQPKTKRSKLGVWQILLYWNITWSKFKTMSCLFKNNKNNNYLQNTYD